jgi:hypothetical protein
MRNQDEAFDERGLLKDGHTFKVPRRMLDGYQRKVARHYSDESPVTGFGSGAFGGQREGDVCTIDGWPGHLKQVNGPLTCVADRQQDSAAFPRRPGVMVTDAQGGIMGLHRPGVRLAVGDQALGDSREAAQRARDRYDHDLTSAWKRRDAMAADPDDDDDAEVESRAGAIRNALLARGHQPDEVENYLATCEDDDLLDGDIGDHVAAFEQQQTGRDTRTVAVDRRIRLEELYQARDRALSEEWKKGNK